ncbi:MAG: hypothetical protein AAFQ98_03940, partial [Bacteroidota bacterium]
MLAKWKVFLGGLALAWLPTTASLAQSPAEFWSRHALELRIGIHQVGLPFYRLFVGPANLSVGMAYTRAYAKETRQAGGFYQNLALTWHTNAYSSGSLGISTTT